MMKALKQAYSTLPARCKHLAVVLAVAVGVGVVLWKWL